MALRTLPLLWHSSFEMADPIAAGPGSATTKAPIPAGPAGETAASARTMVSRFWTQVKVRADAPALYWSVAGRWRSISWSSFGETAEKLALYLIGEGVEQQEHVAIWSGNRPEWHIADIATLSIRARPAPVFNSYSAPQGAYVVGHCEAKVAVVENADVAGRLLSQREQLGALRRIVVMDGASEAGAPDLVISWADALAKGDSLRDRQEGELVRRRALVAPEDVATLIYTSGTTGPPKAVMLTHANVEAAIEGLREVMHASPEDRIISYLPLAHIAERLASEFRSYAYGNPTYFVSSLKELPAALVYVRPTTFFGVPRVWEKMQEQVMAQVDAAGALQRMIANWALSAGADNWLADRLVLSKVRRAMGMDQALLCASGAAPMNPEILGFFARLGIHIYDIYGQSEDTALTSMNFPGRVRPGTVGQVLPGNEIRIADDGEILVRGPVVFAGYYKDEKATAETLQDGWLHTGDVGELLEGGYLRITDRKKDIIITDGGKNISPANIEMLLCSSPLIGHAVAIGDRRPFVAALLVLDPEQLAAWAAAHNMSVDAARTSSELQELVQQHVATVNRSLSPVESVRAYRIVDGDFSIGDELTPTLKVRRKVVLEKYAEQIDALYSGEPAVK